MNAKIFITECLVRGIDISLDGNALRVEGDIKPATGDYIRTHKSEIVAVLNAPDWAKGCQPVFNNSELAGWRIKDSEAQPIHSQIPTDTPSHGTCVGCGKDTASMLTTQYQTWRWCCVACFDQRHATHSENATAAIV